VHADHDYHHEEEDQGRHHQDEEHEEKCPVDRIIHIFFEVL